jgi:predicted phosphodiesterase
VAHKWPEDERHRLASLPAIADVSLPGGRLVAIHGHQTPPRARHERLRRRFPSARAIVYGHSHRLEVDQDADPWVLNPGAAGRARTFGGPSCMILTATERAWVLEIRRFPPPGGGGGTSAPPRAGSRKSPTQLNYHSD